MFYDFTFLFNCGFYRNDAPCEYAPFSDGLPIKKYNDGGELEYIYRILINIW